MKNTRRTFLKAGMAAALSGPALFAQGASPARKLRIAGIGVGGMGRSNLQNMSGENIVALCDVDHALANPVFKQYPDSRRWKDFREMLAKQDDIEAVMIATPDHTHAMIAMAALKAGKHVYCQKPLTHDIWEARQLAAAYATAKDKGCVAVMGNQYHSTAGARKVVEWVRSGVIGEVKQVVAWCSLNYRPFGNAPWATLTDKPPVDTPPVPDTLDWDLWIGPARTRPYHATYHPARWRAWWDFGCGMMGDRGVHTLDASVWALDLTDPTSIECLSIDGANEFVHPDKAHVRYQFPARGMAPPVQLDWYSGGPPPELAELTGGRKAGDDEGGAVIIGSRGMISHGTYPSGNLSLFPDALKDEAAKAPSILPALKGSHEAVWIAACKGEGPVSSDFSYASKLTEVTLLGNLAIRMGGKIDWDAAACKCTNRPEAAQFIRLPRREGWDLG
jgi:predicted dehydrogenase